MSVAFSKADSLCVNTLRALAIDAIEKAASGHPGLPLGAAPMAYVLWRRHLRHNPANPTWTDRDRFILSAGHGSALVYSLLHLAGYDLGLDDLKAFRQWGSRTPGHPEYRLTPGVEATTGPLGQGTANAVGMAIAERLLAHRFNRPEATLVDHYTYALVSDGDLMEGIGYEAASMAGHMKLGKLIYLYDANDVTLDGPASLCFSTEDVAARFTAMGWQVLRVEEGNTDLAAIDTAIEKAKAETGRPSLILVKTTIGYGSPAKQGTCAAHGAPLGSDEIKLTKKALGLDPNAEFFVPAEAAAWTAEARAAGADWEAKWNASFAAYAKAHPDLAKQWTDTLAGRLPEGWDTDLPAFAVGEKVATRKSAGEILNAIAAKVPFLVGGDADIGSSTKTQIKGEAAFDGQSGAGRNLHFGIREHAMAAAANGMAYHGGIRPYVSTFFSFSDYMRPSIRLAALAELPVIYVYTHDSLAVGEDGPTHQPVEQLMALRTIPGLTVIRPGDAGEAEAAWRFAMTHKAGPLALVLSRQGLTTLDRNIVAPAEGLMRGAYILADAEDSQPTFILIASGSEVGPAFEAYQTLTAQGVKTRLVSMPSWELFERQDAAYREQVLPPTVKARMAVEAGITLGWSQYVGDEGHVLGVDRFGASAPGGIVLEQYGFSPQGIVQTANEYLNR